MQISGNVNKVNSQVLLKNKPLKNSAQNIASQQENTVVSDNLPSGQAWQAMVGVNGTNSFKNPDKLINKFALTGKLGVSDLINLKKIVKQNDRQAENTAMLLNLVNDKSINSRTLRYICKDGFMSDGMEGDIRMIYSAKQQNVDPNDFYIPHVNSASDGADKVNIGEMFEVEGEKNVFIKNKDGVAEQLKLDKATMIKLFPLGERFANAQRLSGDCYFVSAVNSMMENPQARVNFLKCFEQDGDNINIRFPSSDFVYTAENGEMPKHYAKNYVTGSLGMKLVEHAYGEMLADRFSNMAINAQEEAIKNLEKQQSQTPDDKDIKTRLSEHKKALEIFKEDLNSKNPQYVVMIEDLGGLKVEKNKDGYSVVVAESIKRPEMSDYSGFNFKRLDQMNAYRKTSYENPGDFYRGDGGFMEDVFSDFGLKEVKAYPAHEREVCQLLKNPELSKNYIFSGGTKNEGRTNPIRAELVMDRSLNMYGAHAYRIMPSTDDKGETVFKVSNPWNSSHNTILTFEQLQKFFAEIHVAKVS
ncbi:MAG: hypothetical protein ACI37Z_10670 [Candidatus Gastranaerophilaceae bacterium]